MMAFKKIRADEVRPGALLLEDLGSWRTVKAVRDVYYFHGGLRFKIAEPRHPPMIFTPSDMLWVAQREEA